MCIDSLPQAYVNDADKVAQDKKKYEKARDALERERDSYVQHKECNPKMAAGLDAARATVRKQRAELAMYASVEAAKRDVTLLKGAADAADAFVAYLRAANALADQLADAARVLRAKAAQSDAAGKEVLMEAAKAVKAHEVASEKGFAANDATPAPVSMMGAAVATTAVQEAELAALAAAGREGVLKQGYLNKPAETSWTGGWRRRWVVLSKGTLTYINPGDLDKPEKKANPLHADLKRREKLHAARVSNRLHLGCEPPVLQKDDGDDDILLKENATFNLLLSTIKVDGDPKDSISRPSPRLTRTTDPDPEPLTCRERSQ
jgi:hypothetical protein